MLSAAEPLFQFPDAFRTEFCHVAQVTLELLSLPKITGIPLCGSTTEFLHKTVQPCFHMSPLGYGGHSLHCNLDKEGHIA